MSGYHAHLFLKELGKKSNRDDIGVISENKEKYISFNAKINVRLAGVCNKDSSKTFQLRFIGSCRFTASGLDKRACNMDDDQCKHFNEFHKEEEVFRLIRCKGVYPYEYMDSWKKLKRQSFHKKNAFYSKLNMKSISDQDYEHAQQSWNTMEKKTLGCYHNTYSKKDVLLLTDVFTTFRNMCLEHVTIT